MKYEYTDQPPHDVPDFSAIRRLMRSCVVFAIIMALICVGMCASAVRASAQAQFEFRTQTYITVDTSGQMLVRQLSIDVLAYGDTLQVGPLTWHGITWTKTGDGSLYFLAPGFQAMYSPGPNGQSIIVKPTGRLRVIECYEQRKQWD